MNFSRLLGLVAGLTLAAGAANAQASCQGIAGLTETLTDSTVGAAAATRNSANVTLAPSDTLTFTLTLNANGPGNGAVYVRVSPGVDFLLSANMLTGGSDSFTVTGTGT